MKSHPFYLLFLFLLFSSGSDTFENEQLSFDHVRQARDDKDEALQKLFKDRGIAYPGEVFLRVFKQEKEMELWVKPKGKTKFQLLKTYPICALSGRLGPKRKEGDGQVPEGFYKIVHFNPESSFYLSLGINYPNASDKILSDKKSPGSAIYIHGKCVTIGCMPMTDDGIKEIYWLCVKAKAAGQSTILQTMRGRMSVTRTVQYWMPACAGYETLVTGGT